MLTGRSITFFPATTIRQTLVLNGKRSTGGLGGIQSGFVLNDAFKSKGSVSIPLMELQGNQRFLDQVIHYMQMGLVRAVDDLGNNIDQAKLAELLTFEFQAVFTFNYPGMPTNITNYIVGTASKGQLMQQSLIFRACDVSFKTAPTMPVTVTLNNVSKGTTCDFVIPAQSPGQGMVEAISATNPGPLTFDAGDRLSFDFSTFTGGQAGADYIFSLRTTERD